MNFYIGTFLVICIVALVFTINFMNRRIRELKLEISRLHDRKSITVETKAGIFDIAYYIKKSVDDSEFDLGAQIDYLEGALSEGIPSDPDFIATAAYPLGFRELVIKKRGH